MAGAVKEQQLEKVEAYYRLFQPMYTIFWNRENFHYGFWEPGITGLRQAVERENQRVAELVRPEGPAAEAHVLDCGCGVGGPALYMAKRWGWRITGVTISGRQARTASARARRQGLGSRAVFRVMDFHGLEFPSESFDGVYFIESIVYSAEKSIALKEAWRVSRPGAKLVIADAFVTDERFNDHPSMARVRDGWAAPRLDTTDTVLGQIEAAGFEIEAIRDMTQAVAPSAIIQRRRSFLPRQLLRLLPDEGGSGVAERVRLLKANVEAIFSQFESLESGHWKYALVAAVKR